LILSWVIPKTLKMVSYCYPCLIAQRLRVARRIKKQPVNFTAVKEKLIQSRRYNTLAVIKRHKNHLSLSNSFCNLFTTALGHLRLSNFFQVVEHAKNWSRAVYFGSQRAGCKVPYGKGYTYLRHIGSSLTVRVICTVI